MSEMESRESKIRQIIEWNYDGISPERISLFYSGFSNLWLIEASSCAKKLLLKEIPERFSIEAVQREPVVCSYLLSNGIPTSEFIQTRGGDFVLQDGTRTYHLQRFIEGMVYKSNECPNWIVDEMARLLALIHRHLETLWGNGVSIDEHLGEQWIRGYDKKEKIEKFCEIQQDLSKATEVDNRDEMMSDVEFRIEALDRLDVEEFREIQWDKITRRVTHGDYHCLQVISREKQIAGIVDFISACRLPVVWEVVRAFTQSDSSATNGEVVYDRFGSYLGNYIENEFLSVPDLKHKFDCYFLQLLGSTFGYRQIARGESLENRLWNLRGFARWRTRMCRWLETNRHSLSQRLVEDFDGVCI